MAGQRVIVSVLADTKKFSRAMKGLSREIGLTKLGEGFATVGRKVGTFFKNTIKLAGATGLAIAGLAIKGGFERALNIEDAQAALRGLGHDTKSIGAIMDSALASVKGTAFGLGDAATIASTAVAAGIKPGEKLTRTLKLTANTAALAKTGLGEMGSILNKVWTAGRVQTQELNQLADRGIPIWTALAEKYGVNTAELRKMVTAGKVDAETFAEVLESTVGTAADEMGKTARGMGRNVMAALSRVGEGFVSKLLPTIKDAMGGAMDALDGIAPAVADMGEKFGKWIVGTAVPAVRSLGKWLSGTLWPALRNVWKLVSGAFTKAVRTVSKALKDAGASAAGTGRSIGDTIVAAIRTLGPMLARVIEGLGSFVAWIIRSRDVLAPIAAAIGTMVAAWAAFNKVMQIARAVQLAFNVVAAMNPIGLIIVAIAGLVAGLTYFFTQTETGKKMWASFTKALRTGWDAIVKAFKTGYEAVKKWLEQAWAFIKRVWSYSPLGMIVTNWDKIMAFFRAIPGKVRAFFDQAIAFIKRIWSYTPLGMITGHWDKILAFFRGIPDRIKGFFRGAKDWLVSAGRAIIDGLLGGINRAMGRVRDAARRVGDAITGPVKRVLGIASPSRVFRDLGLDTLKGLQIGLEHVGAVRRAVRRVADVVTDSFDPTLTATAGVGTGGGRGNVTYNITVHGVLDGVDAGRAIRKALDDYERMGGRR